MLGDRFMIEQEIKYSLLYYFRAVYIRDGTGCLARQDLFPAASWATEMKRHCFDA